MIVVILSNSDIVYTFLISITTKDFVDYGSGVRLTKWEQQNKFKKFH